MAKKKSKAKNGRQASVKRVRFEQAEKKHEWLSMLMEGYYITDQGVAKGIDLMEQKGHRLACAKGCSTCCVTHRNIPTYPLELVGISWYATEVLGEPFRTPLEKQLIEHKKGDPCAFLVDGVCAIHPVRPMACRQFNVFNTQCAQGEDAYYTRRQDVLTPVGKHVEKAFYVMMPFYKVTERAEKRRVVENGLMHSMAKDMQTLNWVSLAKKMMAFDMNRSRGILASQAL